MISILNILFYHPVSEATPNSKITGAYYAGAPPSTRAPSPAVPPSSNATRSGPPWPPARWTESCTGTARRSSPRRSRAWPACARLAGTDPSRRPTASLSTAASACRPSCAKAVSRCTATVSAAPWIGCALLVWRPLRQRSGQLGRIPPSCM
jgi:hypothetical protein